MITILNKNDPKDVESDLAIYVEDFLSKQKSAQKYQKAFLKTLKKHKDKRVILRIFCDGFEVLEECIQVIPAKFSFKIDLQLAWKSMNAIEEETMEILFYCFQVENVTFFCSDYVLIENVVVVKMVALYMSKTLNLSIQRDDGSKEDILKVTTSKSDNFFFNWAYSNRKNLILLLLALDVSRQYVLKPRIQDIKCLEFSQKSFLVDLVGLEVDNTRVFLTKREKVWFALECKVGSEKLLFASILLSPTSPLYMRYNSVQDYDEVWGRRLMALLAKSKLQAPRIKLQTVFQTDINSGNIPFYMAQNMLNREGEITYKDFYRRILRL